ncbi:MAG TPA: peptide chain release factor N(5)-glutamine methyltransferase [Acidimicrobiales bacterium]|nr:peptide chain release factor N(5)-glutamine methyltransferase [Acidimicrobiales bacterium]
MAASDAVTTWGDVRRAVERELGSADDARRIVEEACGADWATRLAEPVSERAAGYVQRMVERRRNGEPLQYAVGRWGFRHLDLFVDSRVLIPRPETEVVAGVALEQLITLGRDPTVVDLGTGSGAIALSIAHEVPDAHVWATDVSGDALAVARANLVGLGGRAAPRVRLVEGSWFDALPSELRGRVQLIVSNPPYVAEHEVADLPPEVARWEPMSALVAGPTGLEDVEHLVAEAPAWLARPGALVVEIAPHQSDAAAALARDAGFTEVSVRPDLAGRARALVGRMKG